MPKQPDRRTRLTITLEPAIVAELDAHIDGGRIRNRSHAIEYVLRKHFGASVRHALVLAGGRAVNKMPKCMVTVNGRTVLEYTLEKLRRHGIREIIIMLGEHGEIIRNYFGDGERWGVKVTYLKQKKSEMGTGELLAQAKPFLADKAFVLYYGDVLANVDLVDMIDFHVSADTLATMALTAVDKPAHWGVVRMQGSKIYSFLEKPDARKDLSHIINAGIYIFSSDIFNYLNAGTKRLEQDVIPQLVKERAVAGYVFAGRWYDVGNPESYARAVREWRH